MFNRQNVRIICNEAPHENHLIVGVVPVSMCAGAVSSLAATNDQYALYISIHQYMQILM